MSATRLERGSDNLTYDPQVDGYTSGVFWTTVTGTPAVTSNILRFTSASAYSVARFTGDLDLEFNLTVPNSPSGSEARKWGLFLPSMGNRGAAYFEIAGTTFRVRMYDNNGTTLIIDQAVTWDAAWEATPVRYRIMRTPRSAEFFINETSVCQQLMVDQTPPKHVNIPLSAAISNSEADNLDLTSFMMRNVSNLS